MIASALLPGTPVLLDTDDKWANRPLRGQRGVVVHRYEPAMGSALGADVVVCIGPCGKAAHTIDCHTAVAFMADELHLIPDTDSASAETAIGEGRYGVGVVIT